MERSRGPQTKRQSCMRARCSTGPRFNSSQDEPAQRDDVVGIQIMRAAQVRYRFIVAQPAHADMPENRRWQGDRRDRARAAAGRWHRQRRGPASLCQRCRRSRRAGNAPSRARTSARRQFGSIATAWSRQRGKLRQHVRIRGGLTAAERRACPERQIVRGGVGRFMVVGVARLRPFDLRHDAGGDLGGDLGSCRSNKFSIVPSCRSAQIWFPSAAWTSWSVMRKRLPL